MFRPTFYNGSQWTGDYIQKFVLYGNGSNFGHVLAESLSKWSFVAKRKHQLILTNKCIFKLYAIRKGA